MHLAQETQHSSKVSLLREALVRTGGFQIDALPDIELVSVGEEKGYRCRAQLQVDGQGRLGFFSAGTHDLVEVRECMVCDPRLEALIGELQGLAGHGHFRGLSRLELRVADQEPALLVRASPVRGRGRGRAPQPAKLEAVLRGLGVSFVMEGSEADAELLQRWSLYGDLILAVPPSAFTQVNTGVNRALVSAVVEGARRRMVRRFLDLYCGAGNFSFPLAAEGLSGVGVEINQAAVRAAQQNHLATEERLGRRLDLRFFAGEAEQVLESLSDRGFDLIVLDPPRSGAKGSLDFVIASEARWICLCSCDPVTLARDLKVLVRGGFALDQLTAYDMFPQTHHVEALVWLSRSTS